MSLVSWVIVTFVLGIVAMGLIFVFMKACEKI